MFRFLLGKKNEPAPVTATEPWTELERNLQEAMTRSGIFKSELIEVAIQKIKSQFSSIGDATCFSAMQQGRELTLEEKKHLGLSVRRKYLADFIMFIDVKNLNGRCPNAVYRDVYNDASCRTARTIELNRMKRNGVRNVEILDAYGGSGCSAIRDAVKIYEIDAAPILPLPGCDMDYCRCCYAVASM